MKTEEKHTTKKDAVEDQPIVKTLKKIGNDEEVHLGNFTPQELLNGDILTASFIRRQIWLILLIVFFTIIYISNRYNSQQEMIEIDKMHKELLDVKYDALTRSSELSERCRQSHILEYLQQTNDSELQLHEEPPFVIDPKNAE